MNLRFLVLRVIAPAILLVNVLVCQPSYAAAPKPLSGHEIAEQNKPGVILIHSVWSVPVSVYDPWFPGLDDIKARVNRQVREGLIANKDEERGRAVITEILKNFFVHIKPDESKKTDSDEPIKFRGSGFIITPDGYIVTNAHLVTSSSGALMTELAGDLVQKKVLQYEQIILGAFKLEDGDPLQKSFEDALRSYFLNGGIRVHLPDQMVAAQSVTATIPIFDGMKTTTKWLPCDVRNPPGEPTPGKDVAILKVEAEDLPTVQLGDDSSVVQGDPIYILGFPAGAEVKGSGEEAGVEVTLTAGLFSARRQMQGGWKAIQTDAAVNGGNSGGPAFNEHGQVIGIATFSMKDTQGIHDLVPMSVANQFIQEHNIKPRDSELSIRYRKALATFEAGDYENAQKQFVAIKEDSSGFPFVQEYIDRCKIALRNQGSPPYQKILMWGVIAGIGVVVIWLVMRKRGAQVAPASAGMQAIAGDRPGAGPKPLPGAVQHSFGSLQGTAGPLSGQRFQIPKDGLKIGRDPSKCQIVIPSDAVSQEHAWVVPLETGVMLIDSGSTNGVFLNSPDSAKVSKVPLKHGDRILIGRSVAIFTYHSV